MRVETQFHKNHRNVIATALFVAISVGPLGMLQSSNPYYGLQVVSTMASFTKQEQKEFLLMDKLLFSLKEK